MRLVCRRDDRARDAEDRLAAPLVDARQVAPPSGDLHRVDDDAAAREGLERRDVVAVLEPAVEQTVVERFGRRALVGDDRHGRGDEPGVGLVEHEQDRAVAGLIAAVGLGAVVQAEHRGSCCRVAGCAGTPGARRRTTRTRTRRALATWAPGARAGARR